MAAGLADDDAGARRGRAAAVRAPCWSCMEIRRPLLQVRFQGDGRGCEGSCALLRSRVLGSVTQRHLTNAGPQEAACRTVTEPERHDANDEPASYGSAHAAGRAHGLAAARGAALGRGLRRRPEAHGEAQSPGHRRCAQTLVAHGGRSLTATGTLWAGKFRFLGPRTGEAAGAAGAPLPPGAAVLGDPKAVQEQPAVDTSAFHTAGLDMSRWHRPPFVSYKDIALAWSLRGGGRWHLVRGRLWVPRQGPVHTPAP